MFVHLRLHTEFSIVDGTNRVDEVVKAADEARTSFQRALKLAETVRDAERLTLAAQDGLRRVARLPAAAQP